MRLFLAAVCGVLVLGCNSRDAGNLSKDANDLVKHSGEAVGSVGLSGRVWAALSQRKGVDVKGIHIDAQDGVVTVSGHVKDRAEKRRVVETIDGTRGVDKVIDKLKIAK